MKKFLIAICLFMVSASLAYGAQPYGNRKSKSIGTLKIGDAATTVVSSGTTLYKAFVTGTTAGDWVVLYKGSSTSGTYVVDVNVGTAADTEPVDFGDSGIDIGSTGDIYVDTIDTGVAVTLVYD